MKSLNANSRLYIGAQALFVSLSIYYITLFFVVSSKGSVLTYKYLSKSFSVFFRPILIGHTCLLLLGYLLPFTASDII